MTRPTPSQAATVADHPTTESTDRLPRDLGSTYLDEPTEGAAEPTERGQAARYEDLGLIGAGGMGEVRRVRDRELERVVAMKVLRSERAASARAIARFVAEAQATAQLQHPNIVPIYDAGALPDGRLYFTMREVRGRPMAEVIDEVHRASRDGAWRAGPTGWTFRDLVVAFRTVCDAVAYAHERGVVHRDLKPTNVVLGEHGEVVVVDWGLARVLGRPEDPADEVVVTERSRSGSLATQVGAVAGTPAYMPPEQAQGAAGIDARADVYALGATLYELLCGHTPYAGSDAAATLAQVVAGPPVAPAQRTRLPLPVELVAACDRAMARDPADRFPAADALADEVADWLNGARRQDQALALVARALALEPEADALQAQVDALRAQSEAMLAAIPAWRPEEDKAAAWARAARADELERTARLKRLSVEQGLHGALQVQPDLAEAHAALALRTLDRHALAEAQRDPEAAAAAEIQVRHHAAALPVGHPARVRCEARLRGDGALTLVTDPPGAEVLLHRYTLHNRRLVAVFDRSLGTTPLTAIPLPMGSYLCVLRHRDRAEVRYPVHVGRMEHWDGIAPGESDPRPIALPARDRFGADEVFVAAGWFRSGGDAAAVGALPARRLWCESFVVQRFPVTNRQYVAFLDDLVAQGREEEALRHVPRERGGTEGEAGAPIYGRDRRGRFVLRPDADGDLWQPDWPVFMVDWHGASAYLAWRAARDGRPWRLPGQFEREKAARGVDGRFFPWGDHLDPSWAHTTESHPGARAPAVVDSYPVDVSVWGVRGLAGNARDWCLDRFTDAGPDTTDGRARLESEVDDPKARRVAMGGGWISTAVNARSAKRVQVEPGARLAYLGFRGAWSEP